ncbi:MAG: hypothetical protein NZ898_04460 [Myxococcota bacterium]|nr:hypothetical protein [Myxococcota bacterium]MDW8362053.1 hypothetical protein [Myxococcales bacterium]
MTAAPARLGSVTRIDLDGPPRKARGERVEAFEQARVQSHGLLRRSLETRAGETRDGFERGGIGTRVAIEERKTNAFEALRCPDTHKLHNAPWTLVALRGNGRLDSRGVSIGA